MVKQSDIVFTSLMESINEILGEAEGKRGRRKADYILQGHNPEIFKMLLDLRNRGMYLVNGLAHKDTAGNKVNIPLPAASLSTITRYLFEKGFGDENSKRLIQILGKRIQDLQDLYNKIADAAASADTGSGSQEIDWDSYLTGSSTPTMSANSVEDDDMSEYDLEDDDDFEP